MASRSMITRSFRLEEALINRLEQIAAEEGLSVNAIASRAFRKLVEFDTYADKMGMMTVSRNLFDKMLSTLNDQDVRNIGRWTGSNLGKEFMAIWFKKMDVHTAVQALALASKFARAYEYDFTTDGKAYTIVLTHGMGPKASTYYAAALTSLLGELLGQDVQVDSTDQSVICRVNLRGEPSKLTAGSSITNVPVLTGKIAL